MSTIDKLSADQMVGSAPKPPAPPNALEAIRDELSALARGNIHLVSSLTTTCVTAAGSWPAQSLEEAPPTSDGLIGEIWGLLHSLNNQNKLAWNCADRLQVLFGKQG